MKLDDELDIITEMKEYMSDSENCLQSAVYLIDGGFYKDSLNRSTIAYLTLCARVCLL